jgi:hypothetical protein
MPNPSFIRTLEHQLVKHGLGLREVERRIQEVADHYEDLKQAAMDSGLAEAEAESKAAASIGQVDLLADQMASSARRSHWQGRHRFLAFCLLPPIAVSAMLLAILFSTILVIQLLLPNTMQTNTTADPVFPKLAVLVFSLIKYAATAFAAFTFYRMAQRAAVGFGWVLAASALCGFHSYLMQANASAHSFTLGFSSNNGDLRGLFLPLLIVLALWARQMRRELNLSPALLCLLPVLAGLMTGCASGPTPVHERAWIGGSYMPVNTKTVLTNSQTSSATNTMPIAQKGLLLSDCATNTPIYSAGVRQGDILLQLNDKRVKSVSKLDHIMANSKPGTPMSARVFRNGQVLDYQFKMGREKYNREFTVAAALPTFVHGWDLWPDPGFSLVFLGYEPYCQQTGAPPKDSYVNHWSAWLVILEFSKGLRILSQENVP